MKDTETQTSSGPCQQGNSSPFPARDPTGEDTVELNCLSQDTKAKSKCPDLTHLADLHILQAGSQEVGDEGCPNIQFTQSTSGLGRTHCRFLEITLEVHFSRLG